MKKKIVIVVIAIAVIFVIVKIVIPNEKKLLARDIKSLKNAVEKEDKISILRYIDEDYNDSYNATSQKFVNVIDGFFTQVESIKIIMSGMKIWIDSTDSEKTIFASCSLGLRIFAQYEGEKVLVFGGVIKPEPVRAYFKKSDGYYKINHAEY